MTLRSAIVKGACETVGGAQTLARMLGVPVELLARWMDGDEPPESVYRACVDIVLLHDDASGSGVP